MVASCQFEGKRQHLSKRGSPYLRRALCLATHSAHLRNRDLHAYWHRKLDEGRAYKAAVIATNQQRLGRVYLVLEEDPPFEVRSCRSPSFRSLTFDSRSPGF